jgi:hypothetical protein
MNDRMKATIGLMMCVGLGIFTWFGFGSGKSEAG